MESKNKDWFKYDTYWRQWSRVICRGGGNYDHEISIPITPINDEASEWSELAKIQIHRFDIRYASFRNKNKYTHVLPDAVYEKMKENLSNNKIEVLLHSNILPLIDWDKYVELGDSQIPIYHCSMDQTGYFTQLYAGNPARETFPTAEQFKREYGVHVPEDHILLGGVYHEHGNDHVRCHGTHDLANNTISFEVLLDGENYSIATRFSSRLGDTESSWDKGLLEFMQGCHYVKIETYDAILKMVCKTINNLNIYKKN